MYPPLDKDTADAINALTPNEVSRRTSYAFEHELLGYGIEAVSIVHIMRVARGIPEGEISLEQFLDRYQPQFHGKPFGFSIELRRIEADGIFIPRHAYRDPDRVTNPFNTDLGNYVNSEYAEKLYARDWSPEDLTKPELIEEGIRLGKDLWQACAGGFEKTQSCVSKSWSTERGSVYGPPQPANVTELGRKLIAYYSGIVD